MKRTYKRHDDSDIEFWAEVYTELDMTFEEIEEELAISHSTLYWCFIHRLPEINYSLYQEVMKTLDHHIHNHKR